MALSNLNPARLVSFEFKAPAPSSAQRAVVPAPAERMRSVEPRAAESNATDAPYRVEPMLLLHQERVETMRQVSAYVARAIHALLMRS